MVVVANFFHEPRENYVIGFPSAGTWTLRFNSDWQGYSDDFAGHPSTLVVTEPGEYDVFPCHGTLSIGPYSVRIFVLPFPTEKEGMRIARDIVH